MEETQNLRALIYLDDVLLTEGAIQIRTAQGVDLLIDGTLDPDDLHSLIARSTCIVNGLPATPVDRGRGIGKDIRGQSVQSSAA